MEYVKELLELGNKLTKWLNGSFIWVELDYALTLSEISNPYFTPIMQKKAISSICNSYLNKKMLYEWLDNYPLLNKSIAKGKKKKIAVVMAGNLPLVGFFDLICVLVSGNTPLIKLSSKDSYLMKILFPDLKYISKEELINEDFDAIITMGANQAAQFFESKFPNIPKLIRRSRYSVGIINGSETNSDLEALADDILLYYGMGCRSVSKIFVPKNYDFSSLASFMNSRLQSYMTPFFEKMYKRSRAILMMSDRDCYYDTGKFLFVNKLEGEIQIATVGYKEYNDENDLRDYFTKNSTSIQKIYTTFGSAQKPSLTDYPDGEDVLKFLENLN